MPARARLALPATFSIYRSSAYRSRLACCLAAATFSLSCLAVGARAQFADDPAQDRRELDRLQADFVKEQEQTRQAMLDRIDDLIANIGKQREMGGSERASLIKKWKVEKERFAKSGELSANADLTELALEYGLRVSKHYGPL